MSESTTPDVRLGVLVPCRNEHAVLPLMHPRLTRALQALGVSYRILYVDDGSTDDTAAWLGELARRDPHVAVLQLSRNFGKEAAMSAGLDHLEADAVLVIDADLQDPPELLPEFWRLFEAGHDVIYGVRRARLGESWLKRATAAAFYRVIGGLSRTPVPSNVGDFRLLSRRAVLALRRLPERQRFMKGLFGWIGFRQVGVPYEREPRAAGRTNWNYWRLWNFALDGITSFSTVPLKLATYAGLATALGAFGYGAWVVVKTMLFGEIVKGYPSLMVVVLFLGGIQLMALGMLGEYVGRLYDESKRRPLYLVQAAVGAGFDAGAAEPLPGEKIAR